MPEEDDPLLYAVRGRPKFAMPTDPQALANTEAITIAALFAMVEFIVTVFMPFIPKIYPATFAVLGSCLVIWLIYRVIQRKPLEVGIAILLVVAVIFSTIIIGYVLNESPISRDWFSDYKPGLTIPEDKDKDVVVPMNNKVNQSMDTTIQLPISNLGTQIAYNIRLQMCGVDGRSLETVLQGKAANCQASDVNPLQPQEQKESPPLTLSTSYTEAKGVRIYSVNRWFLCFKLTWEDKGNGGSMKYYYSYDINNPNVLSPMTIEEQQQFLQSATMQALVK